MRTLILKSAWLVAAMLAFSMAVADFSIAGKVTRSGRGITVSGNDVEITGSGEDHLVVKNARGVFIHDVSSDHSIVLENCESVVVARARVSSRHPSDEFADTRWALKVDQCRNVVVKDSVFDGATHDAVMVSGNGTDAEWRYFGHQQQRGYDPQDVRYGKPRGVGESGWEWRSMESYRRPGKKIWHGRRTDTGSSNISFWRCDFRNAVRAGLFLVWTNGYTVADCTGAQTGDYVMGAEWCTQGRWLRNQSQGDMAFWYFTQDTTVSNCVADTMWLGSNGEPCINVLFERSVARKSLYLCQGTYWEWELATWFEGVRAVDFEADKVYVSANNEAGVAPELLAAASLTRVKAKTLFTSSAVIDLDNCDFGEINRWTPKGGVPSVLRRAGGRFD